MPPQILRLAAGALLLASGSAAHASCGSAYCLLNTDWDMQGNSAYSDHVRLDLRYEFIRQDRLWSGSHSIPSSEDTGDATELYTYNRNLLATLDYTFSPRLGVSLSLPVVSRTHAHIADPTGEAMHESWSFAKTGDARVLGRYQFTDGKSDGNNFGLHLGIKLPTGDYQVANADGSRAERALQPGSGSTDLIVGGYWAYRPRLQDPNWFVQGLYQTALTTKDGFRPGNQLSITGGVRVPSSEKLAWLFQLNALFKEHDSGQNAEPALSGGQFLYASPGLSYAVTRDLQAYGFVQVPVYRHVTGIQLSADWALVGGVSYRF